MPNPAIAKEIEILLNTAQRDGEDFAFQQIGAMDPDRAAGGKETVNEIVAAGKEWWERNEPVIKSTVCNREATKIASSTLIDLVFQVLSIKFGEALAVYATVLAVRRVLQGWCEGFVEDAAS